MKITELAITAALTTIMTTAGIKILSPGAQAAVDTVTHAATVQDWKWAYASEISGRDYTAGISSPININDATAAIIASGILEKEEIRIEAEAAQARWNATAF